MAITNAISDLFASIYELFASVFGAIYSILHSFVNAVISFVTGIFTLAGDILQGLVKAVGGLTQFVLGNVVLLAIGAIGAFVYIRYTAQGQRVAAKTPASKN